MTGTALLGLALLAAPFSCCGWAWLQWHREQLALPLVLTAVEPSTARQDCAPGVFEPCPWVKAA